MPKNLNPTQHEAREGRAGPARPKSQLRLRAWSSWWPVDESVAPQIALACQHERKYIVSNNSDGAALHGKEMKMSPRKFVYIGSMHVEIIDAFPT